MSSCGNPATEEDALMSRQQVDQSLTRPEIVSDVKSNLAKLSFDTRSIAECFLTLITSKFKKILSTKINYGLVGNNGRRAQNAPGNLLVACSGGLGSTVLLDVLHHCYFQKAPEEGDPHGGKDHPRNGKIWKKAAVCYVEVCNAFDGMKDRTEEVRAVVDQYDGFEFIPLRIEDAFSNAWWESIGGKAQDLNLQMNIANEDLPLSQDNGSTNPIDALRSYISSLPTQTAIPTALDTLTRLLLLHTAASTGSSHLLLGTSLTSLSISLISSIAQGGGFVVREEAEESWTSSVSTTRNPIPVQVVRPLRDLGMKDCAAWAWWKQLTVVGRERYPGARQGIGKLTKDFIVGLERDYPSTVSTIARTCAKLTPKQAPTGICVLCERPVQSGVQEWKAQISIRSTAGDEQRPPGTESDGVTKLLCYACHTTLTSRSSRGSVANGGGEGLDRTVPLPAWSGAHILESEVWTSRNLSAKEMRSSIDKFLLE